MARCKPEAAHVNRNAFRIWQRFLSSLGEPESHTSHASATPDLRVPPATAPQQAPSPRVISHRIARSASLPLKPSARTCRDIREADKRGAPNSSSSAEVGSRRSTIRRRRPGPWSSIKPHCGSALARSAPLPPIERREKRKEGRGEATSSRSAHRRSGSRGNGNFRDRAVIGCVYPAMWRSSRTSTQAGTAM